jgi:hypothetical protein
LSERFACVVAMSVVRRSTILAACSPLISRGEDGATFVAGGAFAALI